MEEKVDLVNASWFQNRWRPATAWAYLLICLSDFLISPITFALLQSHNGFEKWIEWHPITLQGGGLIHVAFGSILGVTAWSRGQEKITQMQVNSTPGFTSTEQMNSTMGQP